MGRGGTREHEIRLLLADERLSLRRVGRRDDELGGVDSFYRVPVGETVPSGAILTPGACDFVLDSSALSLRFQRSA